MSSPIGDASRALARAKRVVVFSGAGMSAESGIQTFRDPEAGVWANKFRLFYYGTPIGWTLTPTWAWETYVTRFLKPILEAEPNPGHIAIARLENIMRERSGDVVRPFCIITQNVDGLHQRAGNTDDLVYEVHGTVRRQKCTKHHHLYQIDVDPETDLKLRCPECGGCLRPDAVLFTEGLPRGPWTQSHRAVQDLRPGDCMIIIGTSGLVYPAASLPERAIERNDITVIEVNPEPSTLTPGVDYFIQDGSGVALPPLIQQMERYMEQ
eukprot:TRINITY_DN5493_c0_g1_i2.p1 TRINITY_DN5493_c0_g1~~TRINITY_DN5493_c0_g1_i2.p1  ORF type:complete len:267 (-),score=20.69 TRINITY_DN5493_c0_g1_i2:173-973(-)